MISSELMNKTATTVTTLIDNHIKIKYTRMDLNLLLCLYDMIAIPSRKI